MATTTANWLTGRATDWLPDCRAVSLTLYTSVVCLCVLYPPGRRIQFAAEAENWCQRRNGANSLTHKFLAVKIALMNTRHGKPRRHKANSSRLDFLQFSFGFLHAGPAIHSFIVWPRVNSRVHFKRQRNPQPISKEIRKVAETIYLINLPALG